MSPIPPAERPKTSKIVNSIAFFVPPGERPRLAASKSRAGIKIPSNPRIIRLREKILTGRLVVWYKIKAKINQKTKIRARGI